MNGCQIGERCAAETEGNSGQKGKRSLAQKAGRRMDSGRERQPHQERRSPQGTRGPGTDCGAVETRKLTEGKGAEQMRREEGSQDRGIARGGVQGEGAQGDVPRGSVYVLGETAGHTLHRVIRHAKAAPRVFIFALRGAILQYDRRAALAC